MIDHRRRLGSGWGRALATVSLVAAGAVVTTGGAAAAPITISVTNTVDSHAAGSLREAVDQVNAGTFDAITIELPAGTYALDLCGAGLQDETNVAGDLDPNTGTAPLTIVGLGGGATIHQTCPGQRVLDKRGGGRLTLRNVTLTGGNVVGRPAIGGAIRAGSPVTLEHVALTGNVAQGTDGSPAINNATGATARGGAVYAVGAVTVRDSSISGNRAIGGKGSYDWVLDQPSNGGPSSGGAIETTGRLTVSNTTFTDNRALGGVFQGNGAGGEAVGGAAVAGSADVRSTLFDGNMADAADSYVGFACPICPLEGYPAVDARGGALSTGTGSVRLEGVDAHDNAAYGGFGASGGSIAARGIGGVVSGGAVEVVGGTYTDNAATVMGGAVFSTSIAVSRAVLSRNHALDTGGAVASYATTIRDSTLSGNVAHVGGAVAGGTMIIEDSTFSGNETGVGSTSYFGDTTPAMGGAVSSGNLTAARSTFVDNTVAAPPLCTSPFGCTVSPVTGGAISSNGTVTLDAVTIARNVVGRTVLSSPNGGGGIYATGAVTATNSTIVDNDAYSGSGVKAPSVDLTNVTLTGNGASRLGAGITSPVVHARQSMLGAPAPAPAVCSAGAVGTSGGYNRVSDATCGLTAPTDQVSSANVLLGPLQDNGGPTPTRLPAAASPLVDAVPPASCAVVTDQRGASRPQAAGCEIGAVEVLGPAAPSDLGVAIAGPATGEVGTPIELVVTVNAAGGVGYPTLLVTLPPGWGDLTDVVAPAGVHCVAPDATSIRCDQMAGVPDGSSFDVHLTLTLPPGSQLDVTAAVTGRGEDPEAGNDTAVHAIALTTTTTTTTTTSTSTTSTSTTSTSTSTSTSSTTTTAPTTTSSSTSTTSTTEPTTTSTTSSTSTTSTTVPTTTTSTTSTTSTTEPTTTTSTTSTTSTTEPSTSTSSTSTSSTSTTEPTTTTSSTLPPSSTTSSTSSTSTSPPSTSSTTQPSTSRSTTPSSTSTTLLTSSTTAAPTSTTAAGDVGPASTDPDAGAAAVAGAGLTAGTLPVTGSPAGTSVAFAALLLAVGAAALVVSRRAGSRRASH